MPSGIETLGATTHLFVMMTHTLTHPQTHEHTATSHLGEVGFYSLLGMAAVSLLLMFGVYWLAQDALQGVAALFAGL